MTGLTVLVFFATWCTPCRQELPHIARLARSYGAPSVKFVLVSEDSPSTAPNVPAFLARFQVPAEVEFDTESERLARYNPTGSVPFVAIVDDSGQVLYSHANYEPGDERALEAALQAMQTTQATASAEPRRSDAEFTLQSIGLLRTTHFGTEPDSSVTGGIARFDGSFVTGAFEGAARIDGAILRAASEEPAADLRLERLRLAWRAPQFTLAVGDSYASINRGLSLSVRKVDSLGVDTAVRGLRLDLRGDTLGVTALAGALNPQNLDPIGLRIDADPNDLVAALEVTETLAPMLRVAQSIVALRLGQAATDGADIDQLVGGFTIGFEHDRHRIGLAAAGLARSGVAADGVVEPGYAVYGSWSSGWGPLSLLLEGKFYRRFDLGRSSPMISYHEPPTLEREDQEVPGNTDAIGGRIRAEWRLGESWTLIGNAVVYGFTNDDTDPWHGPLALHGYAGFDWRQADTGRSLFVSAGGRREENSLGDESLSFLQANADFAARLGPLGFTAKADVRLETKLLFEGPKDYVKSLFVLGLAWPGRASLSLVYGYSTEAEARPTHYPGAELRVELGRTADVRLFGGRLAGGRICISGACRDIPSFEGARAEIVLRY